MYVNPQPANYKVFVSQHMSNMTILWSALVAVKLWTHIFSNWQFVLTIIREIVPALYILHIQLAS